MEAKCVYVPKSQNTSNLVAQWKGSFEISEKDGSVYKTIWFHLEERKNESESLKVGIAEYEVTGAVFKTQPKIRTW